ncbi:MULTISPECIES: tol-pal system-associated acyl-CoA thioesterase [Alteromonadaceae]|uniref:Tol-pal system-associated acyl-CoA thioesterase n=1 Tax=Brumicola blandensis TaxID=3075611 RepID=A0AAW8QVG4_9ALTE|nr:MULTISPECIES: tol-pal system-associated acyl-CoA thioesterase [unclassified Alteromonas]MDT0581011.1 tol-pal system-associated acyl-CoA thioesterase [Alteromonas sp. W409]MDT0629561.1 tol-pal system-associated acyl-CoA thioesterase [Alteromonas sp. W364]
MNNSDVFSIPIRVYYEDTDAGGIVYHTNYLKFMERARTEWLRDLGLEQQSLLEQSVGFVVKDLNMQNTKAAVFNDMLSISCEVVELRKASMLFKQHAYRVKDDSLDKNIIQNNKNNLSSEKELLVSAEVRVACVDLGKMKPIAIPDFILREIKRAV